MIDTNELRRRNPEEITCGDLEVIWLRVEKWRAEGAPASISDKLNSWAREAGTHAGDSPEDARDVADELWAKTSGQIERLRAALRTLALRCETLAAQIANAANANEKQPG